MAEPSLTEYAAVRATPTLVDRLPALDTIKRAIDDRSRSYIVYISGDGGTGKTFLTRAILERCREGGEWHLPDSPLIATESVVDFYHTETHSLEGFTSAVWRALGKAGAQMGNYMTKLAEFESRKPHLAEMLRELSNHREEVARAFLHDLNALPEDHRLVLALDTAERLLYDTDDIKEVLDLGGETDHGIAVLPWLLDEFFPGLENAVVIIAARPSAERLKDDLRRVVGERFKDVELSGFATKEDAGAYFDAVAQAARQDGKEQIAERIDAIPPDTREVIWLYTGGRPILLSLMVDYLVVASELLPLVKVPVEEARARTPAELEEIAAQLEAELVRLFQNQGRPADEAIRLLGWARRGLDAKLLAHVSEMEIDEAEVVLAELADLSFVKMREDGRAFAHDIFGEMLERHVLATLPKKRRDRTYQAILEHYEKEIAQARADVERLWAAESDRMGKEPDLLAREKVKPEIAEQPLEKALHRLYRLMPEEVFYRLRLNAAAGFRAYYTYKKEAGWANEETLDMELRSELLQFAAEQESVARFDGVTRNDLDLDSGLSWIERNIRRARYKRALQIATDLEEKCEDLFEKGDPLDRAQLAAYKALALTYTGDDLEQAEDLLTETVRVYESFHHENQFQIWRRDTALADALNTLGFLYRTQGLYPTAIAAYRRALPLWRSLADRERVPTMHRAIEAQHANTLNNLSWALAWVGHFRQAEFACQDALAMRRRLGPLGPLAFSLNTLGLIQIKNDQPHRGGVNCAQALEIFRYLEQPRGAGLARIALAEALRRRATIPDLYTSDNRTNFLLESAEHAREAVRIFTEELQEPPQLIQARIEQGCTYRDLASVHRQVWGLNEKCRELADLGEQALRKAIEAGEEEHSLQHMVLDARVNLAWLYAEIDEVDQAELELKEALNSVAPEYRIEAAAGLPVASLPQSFLWVQMGKAHLLHGKIAIDQFQACKPNDCQGLLEKAAEHYTLALAYYGLFAPDFRDIRQGMRRIYDSLKGLGLESEFPSIQRGAGQAAEKYGLEPQTGLQQFLDDAFGLA